jgi:hypothetical protein
MSWRLGNGIRVRSQRGFTALENLNVSYGINRAWENMKENIKTSAKESLLLCELKQHET